jgi:sn-glycerol 3-phosphate transport system substrate-binding protein
VRKPLLSLVVVLLLCVTLGACGGGEEGTPTAETPGTQPTGPVTIDLWHSEVGSNVETLDRLVDQFNASQGEVTVRTSFQGTYDEAAAKLIASLGTEQVPAVVLPNESQTQRMIDSGAVAPIQEFIDEEDYDLSDIDEKALQYFTVEDKLWALPFAGEMALLYYNKVTFREVGLDPEKPPKDLEELREYSEKIFKRDASGNVVRSGIALDIHGWLSTIIADHGDLWVDQNNGHDGRATKVLFDNDTGRWFFQWWHDMVDSGLAFNVGRNPNYVDNFLAIASGRAAMALSYAGALRSVVDALEAGEPGAAGVEFGVSQVPGVPGGKGYNTFSVYAMWIMNQRPEQEQQAAWKFIKWLAEPEQQAEWFAGTGYLPVSLSAVDLPAAQDLVAKYPLFKVVFDLYQNTPVTPATAGAILGPADQVAELTYTAEEAMLVGGKDPAQALADAAAKADETIAEYNRRVGD